MLTNAVASMTLTLSMVSPMISTPPMTASVTCALSAPDAPRPIQVMIAHSVEMPAAAMQMAFAAGLGHTTMASEATKGTSMEAIASMARLHTILKHLP